jgi:hypothetical protein
VGQMRLALGGQPFKAIVQVKREEVTVEHGVFLGTKLVPVDRPSQVVLAKFLRHSTD